MQCNIYLREIRGAHQCQECGNRIHYRWGLNSEDCGRQESEGSYALCVTVKEIECSEKNVQKLSRQ